MTDWKFEMGDELVDTITGFKGIVVGRSEFITGCHRYLLQPKCKKNELEKLPDPIEMDVTTLKKTRSKRKKILKTGDGGAPTKGKSW